jgi:hypothetical protein
MEAVKETCFIFYLLRFMGIPVKLTIIVRADDFGAMFMAENASYIDTRYHSISEHDEGGFIHIVNDKTDNSNSKVVHQECQQGYLSKECGGLLTRD